MLKLIDVTIRDGGFNNNWEFSDSFVHKYLNVIEKINPIEYIELGYITPCDNIINSYRYCQNISSLKYIIDQSVYTKKFCFMIDLKDYIVHNKVNEKILLKTIPPVSKGNPFTLCRICITKDMISKIDKVVNILTNTLGYNVTINIMQISTLLAQKHNLYQEFKKYILPLEKKLFGLYFADSFGGLTSSEIKTFITQFLYTPIKNIGLHLHNNLGNALNSIIENRHSIKYADCSILGIGRGAGNLITEEIVSYLGYNVYELELFNIQFTNFMKLKYKFGINQNYILSSKHNIHPNYCAYLYHNTNFESCDIFNILLSIPMMNRKKFDNELLQKLISEQELRRKNKYEFIIPKRSGTSR